MATRRELMIIGGATALWLGGIRALPHLRDRLAGFTFVDLVQPEGFRALSSGRGTPATGGYFDITTGLDPADPFPPGLLESIESEPATFLFNDLSAKATPVAYFFDYYCPYCRIVSDHLDNLVSTSEISLTHHHWPIFGEASVLAARAVLAAGIWGDAEPLHNRLKEARVRVTLPYLETLADSLELPWPDIARSMHTPAVTAVLDRTRALARLFGIVGTPALVVGRTLVEGQIAEARLKALVRLEKRET
ncbi:DsbA family protein [Paracoccus sp. TK19116]|uniref:DsbA family protein n=1 Tax=Paracoccus albicereus TaxID=2922394 RepID=A0ABT1MW81_9RHOB|nr:DsbA family protein [Paracoccus albicereus]MCQ0971766.1 DsbA family protein [Paracoccus albicereus]